MSALRKEPNNKGTIGDSLKGRGEPDCVHMFPKDNKGVGGCHGQCSAGAWADFSCTREDHYVCEIRA
jgi:hypothetical protein